MEYQTIDTPNITTQMYHTVFENVSKGHTKGKRTPPGNHQGYILRDVTRVV